MGFPINNGSLLNTNSVNSELHMQRSLAESPTEAKILQCTSKFWKFSSSWGRVRRLTSLDLCVKYSRVLIKADIYHILNENMINYPSCWTCSLKSRKPGQILSNLKVGLNMHYIACYSSINLNLFYWLWNISGRSYINMPTGTYTVCRDD